ncbi:MAG: class III poly(R)-hydroxyalkanoic acid synthase subunit PhaC [Phycisphaerales bacterium]|nr:class III poly(R)-hydroxyalkanoic acid synthase subunit PhaC [Phycisphaerales bacterium]
MSTTGTTFGFSTPDQALSAWQDLLRKSLALPKVVEAAQTVRVGCTPSRQVYREDKLRLLRYETDAPQRYKTPLLVIFALVNRPYILDLRPGKSVVSHFLSSGFNTYNVDWGVPEGGDRFLSLEDYVTRYIDHVVDHIREETGSEKVNILGYCMGGTLTAMYAALNPDKVNAFVALAAPFDWSKKESLLQTWTDERYFNVDRMLEVYGNAPPQWLQTSFLMLKPVQNLMEKYVGFYENMHDEKFLEDFFAMETWLNDNIPVAGETFRQFVKYCFQQNLLVQGKLHIGNRRVDLKRITCPVLNLIARSDHLVPPSQSLPLNDAVGSRDKKAIEFPAGHIGMAVGSKAHRDLWPQTCTWLGERSEKLRG